jgi:hypothetical protein
MTENETAPFVPEPEPGTAPTNRRIFEYNCDGTAAGLRYADPYAALRGLGRTARAVTGQPLKDAWAAAFPPWAPGPDGVLAPPVLSDEQEEARAEAQAQLTEVATQVFHLQALDPTTGLGLTEEERLGVWDAFNDWVADVKNERGTAPTSAAPTGAVPPVSGSPATA